MSNVQTQISRITQEAFNSISRHANATTVKMVVGIPQASDFSLTIEEIVPFLTCEFARLNVTFDPSEQPNDQ